MRRTAYLFFPIILTSIVWPPAGIDGEDVKNEPPPIEGAGPVHLIDVGPLPFGPGEKLTFVIKYEFMSAGSATLEITDGGFVNGRPTLEFKSNAESNKFVDAFFKVRDYNASHVDQGSLASIHFHQNLREGHYRVIRNTHIDYLNGTYVYERKYKGKTTFKNGPLEQPVSDILSSFFYTRTLPLERGKEYYLDVFSDQKLYPLRVDVLPELDKIKVPAGEFECIVVQPHVVGDAVFKAKDGKMRLWMTNDAKKMPVQIRSKVFIGSFDAELVEYTLSPATSK